MTKKITTVSRDAPGATRAARTVKSSTPDTPETPRKDDFPIVGIGASAGGLEALEQFLGKVPADCGMAFVVVQHLDPTQKGLLPELLQRGTPMRVHQADNRMKIRPNCVYVIPPNKDLSILRGALYLLDPVAPRGLRLPIDFFFRALADDLRERSVGVILSGMGSDGTLGLRAIKERAGLTLVQEPSTAKFDGMPNAAIAAGVADIVAPVDTLPGRILDCLRRTPGALGTTVPLEPEVLAERGALEKIMILLRGRTGHDFSQYKRSTLFRRIERRMGIHQVDRIGDYIRYLRENPQELDLLFNELLIGVTSFFRDPVSWAQLQDKALPALLERASDGKPLRAWVAGCSTGEEAYSLAIAFREVVDRIMPQSRAALQIFATDLDADAIERARQGRYPANIVADVSPERLARYFVEEEPGFRVCKEIREMVVFAPQNLIMDPPFTRLDILCCRNLLIYLGQELQKKLFPLFHYSLRPGGVLFLGSAESIGAFTELFSPVDAKSRIFRRSMTPPQLADVDFPSRQFHSVPQSHDESRSPLVGGNLQSLAEQLLLREFAPAAVLVNADGDIVYISGRTGKFLEPAAGKANWNVYAMARDDLRHEIALALPHVLRSHENVTRRGVQVKSDDGNRSVDLTVHGIKEPGALRNMILIVFTEVATPQAETGVVRPGSRSRIRIEELERALQQAREDAKSMREEAQTSQEELKSTNEELQSTNEELQSTNEELTTSKEEMQSLNEELQTVNAELQAKVDDLTAADSDMRNLLNSTNIATIFLDRALHVRRFTPQATRIFKLIASDTGRPLSDIVTDLDYPELQDDACEVQRTLVFSEKEIPSRGERWYLVKIMPYRTLDNVIDGVVLTCNDITDAKHLEAELRGTQSISP